MSSVDPKLDMVLRIMLYIIYNMDFRTHSLHYITLIKFFLFVHCLLSWPNQG